MSEVTVFSLIPNPSEAQVYAAFADPTEASDFGHTTLRHDSNRADIFVEVFVGCDVKSSGWLEEWVGTKAAPPSWMTSGDAAHDRYMRNRTDPRKDD